jgi:hypothetical protein
MYPYCRSFFPLNTHVKMTETQIPKHWTKLGNAPIFLRIIFASFLVYRAMLCIFSYSGIFISIKILLKRLYNFFRIASLMYFGISQLPSSNSVGQRTNVLLLVRFFSFSLSSKGSPNSSCAIAGITFRILKIHKPPSSRYLRQDGSTSERSVVHIPI